MASQLVPVLTNEATASKRRIYFDLRDATDGITAETGEAAGQPQISTDGGAWTNTGIGTLSSIGNGEYYAELTQSATNIAGGSRIKTRYKSAATAESRGDTALILAYDPYAAQLPANLTQWLGSAPNALVSSRVDVSVGAMAANVLTATAINTGAITAAKFAAGAIDAAAIATDAIDADAIADNAINAGAIATGAITAAKFAAGAIDAAAIATDAITAAKIAADAIGASELAADAVAEIQAGLIIAAVSGTSDSGTTSTMVDAARTEADTDYWKGDTIRFTSGNIAGQSRIITGFNPATDTITFTPPTTQAVSTQNYEILPIGAVDVRLWNGSSPNNLVSNRVDVSVGAMATDVLTSGALATSAVTEIQTGLATSASIVTLQADTDDIQTRLPVALVGGRMDSSVGAMAADVVTAAAIATDAIGSAELASSAVNEIADQVWDELLSGHAVSGSTGEALTNAAASSGLTQQQVRDAMKLAPTAGVPANGSIDLELDEILSDLDLLTSTIATTGTADSGTTTTMVDAGRTEADADYWKGAWIKFTSGTISGQTRLITAFDAATDTITFTPATTQTVGTQTYVILASAGVDLRLWNGTAPNNLISGRVDSSVGAMAAGVITATVIATDAIDADAMADGAITAPTFAAGAIDATAIATNAIGSAELASSAVDKIVDQVWDEVLSGHLTAGTTGAALNAAGSGASAATIADAVWDEARAGHVAAGSFGEGVASVQGNVTGSVASVTGNVGGNVVGSVGSIAAGGLTAASTDATYVTEVEGAADAALVGRRLDELIDQAASPATPTINSFVDRITSKDGTQSYDRSTDSLEAIKDSLSGSGPTAAAIADAVWDEALADHVAAGSMGFNENLIDDIFADTNDIQTRLPATLSGGRMRSQVEGMDAGTVTAAAIATGAVDADALATDAVTEITTAVDAAITAAHGVGSYVDTGAPPTVAAIADGVWDELIAGHLGVGSTGAKLNDAATGGAGLVPQQVRDAMLLAPTGASAPGSIDQFLEDIQGPGFNVATDSLEEIRDEVDACCGASTGGDNINIEGI